jgi:hypothetical protein
MNCLHNHFIGENSNYSTACDKKEKVKDMCDSVELVSVQATVHKEHNCALFQDFLTDTFG